MKFYFTLQLKRIHRYLKEAGFNPYIACLSIIAIFLFASHSIFIKVKFAEYAYPFLALILINKLSTKARNNFLKNCFNKTDYKAVRLIENVFMSIPFSLFLIYKEAYLIAFIFTITVAINSQFNVVNNISLVIPTPFYKKPFEFTIGFRKSFIVFIGCYVLTIISIKVNNFNLGVFSMLVTFLTCMSFYSKPEPLSYVWNYSKHPIAFLITKIKTALTFSFLITIPIALLLLFFNIDMAFYIIIFQFVGMLYIVNNILSKYAYYPSEININQAFIVGASIMFPPLMLLTIPLFYSRAKQQLNTILK